MKKTLIQGLIIKFFPIFFFLVVFIIPQYVLAQDFGLIVCKGTADDPCTFAKLMELVNKLIEMMIVISTILATVAFIWSGFLLLSSGGNEAAKNKAKDMLSKVLKGYLWILFAWLIVYTIVTVLLKPGYSFLGSPQ